jgi:hypothetical protein
MVLLKTFNGTFSACDRFMLKIFFFGVKRMSDTHISFMYSYRTRQRIFRPLTVVNTSGKLEWALHTLHHVTLPMIQIEQSCLNFF